MTKTHEAVIIHDNTEDAMRHMKIACGAVKAKYNIQGYVIPIDYIKKPYGFIVVVELPNGGSRSREVSEAGNKSKQVD